MRIEETGLSPDLSPESPDMSRLRRGDGFFGGGYEAHRKSTSSVMTVKTANSEALERMGQMDVIQRVRTVSTHHGMSPSSSQDEQSPQQSQSPPQPQHPGMRPRLSIVPGSPNKSAASGPSALSLSFSVDRGGRDTLVSSPTEMTSPMLSLDDPPPSSALSKGPRPPPPPPAKSKIFSGGEVAKRVAAYERQMTLVTTPTTPTTSDILQGPRSPPSDHQERRERRNSKAVRVDYGFAERPALFVANPDYRGSRMSTPSPLGSQ